MSLWMIAWRSIQQRGLASALTALSMALGVALVVCVLVMYGVISRSFAKGAEGFDMIVGAKGSKLQLVLNTIYHLSTPVENIPWSYYREFSGKGRFASSVKTAIPLCLGDHYGGFRVVGTVPELFEMEYAPGERYQFSAGHNFEPEHFFEAVVGATAAHESGLSVGSSFQPTHGVVEDGQGHKHDAFKVVGILAPSGTPNDRALFVNIEGFFLLEGHAKAETAKPAHKHEPNESADHDHDHADKKSPADAKAPSSALTSAAAKHEDHDEHDHDHAHREPLPESQREVTAILIRTATPFANLSLPKAINKDSVAQAVFPSSEIVNLFQGIVGNLERLLLILAALVMVVAGIGIMVSIYNSMSDRRREIAVMRSLGAGRTTVLTIVLLESVLLSLGGGVCGFLLGHALIGGLSPFIAAETGVSIGLFQFEGYELSLIPGLIVLATLVGYLPAMAAYRTDVAKALTASP
jgi:putative ABC transport system permease protein